MKFFLPILFVLITAMSAQSQWWFDAGVKGAIGPTLMYDDNSFDSGTHKHKLSYGNAIGGRLGFNYGYHVGLSLEYSAAKSKQEFEVNSNPYNEFTWKHNDIVGVFRYSGNGAYVEFGAKHSKMKSVEVENAVLAGVTDVTDNFEDSYTSGIFGFGSYLAGSELLTLNLGIRLHWGFGEMVNAQGKENHYPVLLPGHSFDPDKKTKAAAAQLNLELNYAFGRFAKAACSDRWRLILFR